jgi:hypothetical protein
MMSFSRIAVAAAVALSMTATPVLAQSAAPLSVAATVDRSSATVEHANDFRRDYVFALVFFAAVIAAILLIGGKHDHDLPRSA